MTQPQPVIQPQPQPRPAPAPPPPAAPEPHVPMIDRLADLVARVDELSGLHNKLADAVTRELGL